LEITEGNIKQTVYVQNCSGKANRTVIQVDNILVKKLICFAVYISGRRSSPRSTAL
jgi:hypothetical protein